jgi:hypothetical protein
VHSLPACLSDGLAWARLVLSLWLQVLSNDELRAKYDRGEDVSGNRQGQPQGHNPFGFPGGGQQHFTFHFSH